MRSPSMTSDRGGITTLLCILAALILFSCAVLGNCQAYTNACIPYNSLQWLPSPTPGVYGEFITDPSTGKIYPNPTADPVVWSPGKTYTVSISGVFPVQDGEPAPPIGTPCPNIAISAWQWPGYPNVNGTGAISQDVTLSNINYVSPTLLTFTASLSSSAQIGEHIFMEIYSYGGTFLYWGPEIQNPPAPNPPYPPQNQCPQPSILAVNPSTWLAGEKYTITVTGTGFTTAAAATSSCPVSVITVSVNQGNVTLSNVVVVNSTTITATVEPAGTDPDEPAQVILWAPYNVIDDDDDIGADDDLSVLKSANERDAPSGYVQAGRLQAQVANSRKDLTQGRERSNAR